MGRHLDRRSALRLSAAAGLGSLVAACAGRRQDTPPTAGGAERLMFIRHGEEPGADGRPFGVTEGGEADPRSLSVRGWMRAGALVGLFDPRDPDGNQIPTRPELVRPTRIFACDPGDTRSRRSLETVTPLAAALDLHVDSRFPSSQAAQVADAIQAGTGPALIAWKHEQIPEIISRLGTVTPATPSSWPGGRFDLIWVLDRNGNGWRFTQIPQMLLAGDLR